MRDLVSGRVLALTFLILTGILIAGTVGLGVATDEYAQEPLTDLSEAELSINDPNKALHAGQDENGLCHLTSEKATKALDECDQKRTSEEADDGAVATAGQTGEHSLADSPDFQIIDADMPTDVGQGHNVTVTADIENVGADGTQTLNFTVYAPEQVDDDNDNDDDTSTVNSVAVVDDPANTSQGEALVDVLDDEFETVDLVTNDNVLDEMSDYEVIVIFRFGSDELAENFLDELDDDQGVVYLDDHQVDIDSESWADGVLRLHNVRTDPGDRESFFLGVDTNPAEVTITDDHPIFDGVGDVGDTVVLNEDTNTWGSSFGNYSGDTVAEVDYSPSEPGEYQGSGIGVNDAENEVLLNALSYDLFSVPDDITDDGKVVLINAIEHVGPENSEGASMQTMAKSDGDDEFPFYGEVVIHVYDDISLDAGETATVELEYEVPENLAPDRYTQELSTNGDAAISELWVELHADIEVASHSLDPDPAVEDLVVGDTLTTEAVLVNHGERPGEFEVEYVVDEEVVSNQTVEVDAEATKLVELDHQLRKSGMKIISVNGVNPIQIDVNPGPSVFDYVEADDTVHSEGLRNAVDDWRAGDIDTDLLHDVVDYWKSGEQIG